MVWALKTGLTPPQVVCACPKSGTVLVIDVSLFHYYYYFIWYTAVYVWIWIWLLLFRAIWGSRTGVHCTCWRPGFDLQVLKFIHIHGYSCISNILVQMLLLSGNSSNCRTRKDMEWLCVRQQLAQFLCISSLLNFCFQVSIYNSVYIIIFFRLYHHTYQRISYQKKLRLAQHDTTAQSWTLFIWGPVWIENCHCLNNMVDWLNMFVTWTVCWIEKNNQTKIHIWILSNHEKDSFAKMFLKFDYL